MAGTFISYRREDAAGYAGRLRESLERRLGSGRVFRDVDALRPGQDFVSAIEARLASCRVTLVVIGRDWLDARNAAGTRRLDEPYDFVRLEVAAALGQNDVLVVPVLVEGASMPNPADLPDNIRLLARRHAVSVRDETWDADVDRLVGIIDDVETPAQPPGRRTGTLSRRAWMASGAVLALILLLAVVFMRTRNRDLSSGGTEPSSPPGQSIPAYTIDVPRIAEAAFGDLVYTLVSGNVTPRASSNELRLRMGLSNNSGYDTNFWDRSFRLLVDGQPTMPTSDLNVLVPGHSLRYDVVTFPLARGVNRVTLQILNDAVPVAAAIPLDVTPTGRSVIDEQAAVADSLSQAIVRQASAGDRSLLDVNNVGVALARATTRRFANVLRLSVQVRFENRGRNPVHSGELLLRIDTGDATVAPGEELNDLIAPASSGVSTAVFDLPASSTRAMLHASMSGQSAELPLDLQ